MTPGHVLRNAPALLLRKARHYSDEQLTLGVEGPDVLLFEEHLGAMLFKLPYGRKAVHRVPCEPADALRDYEVDLARERIRHHGLEALPLFYARPGNTLVGIHASKYPVLMPFDERSVIVKLCLITCQLFVVICRYAGITRNPSFSAAANRSSREPVDHRRDLCYLLCHLSPRSFLIIFIFSLIAAFLSGVHFSFITRLMYSLYSSVCL